MNPTLEKKLVKYKNLEETAARFLDDDDDNFGANITRPSLRAFLKTSLDYAESDEEMADVLAHLRGERAGHMAASIGVEEEPSAAQAEKPRTTRIEKPAAKVITDMTPIAFGYVQSDDRSMLPGPAPSIVIVEPEPVTIVAPALVVHVAVPEPRPVSPNRADVGRDGWIKWVDPYGYGAMPVAVDDVIAYRMRDGNVLCTDYPAQLEWCQSGKRSDIVEYRLLTIEESKDMAPWVEWVGGDCPIDLAAVVQIRMHENGRNDAGIAGLERWKHWPSSHADYDANIVAYRVVSV